MSDFKAKMHRIRFRRWGSLQHSPRVDLLAGFKGPTSKRTEGSGEEGRGGRKRNPQVFLQLQICYYTTAVNAKHWQLENYA